MNILNNMSNPIDPNSFSHVFELSTWGSALAFVFVLATTLIIAFTIYKKNRTFALIPALALGLVGAVIFGLIFYYNPTSPVDGQIFWTDEAKDWLKLFGIVMISLVSIVIPLYIFSIVASTALKTKNIKPKKMAISFGSLSLMPIIGILVALAMIPILLLVPNELWASVKPSGEADDSLITIPGVFISGAASSIAIFASIDSILAVIVFAIIMSAAIKLAGKDKPEIESGALVFFENFNIVLMKYLRIVLHLVPFAIATTLASLTMQLDSFANLKMIGIYAGVFALGGIIIYIIIFLLNLLVSSRKTELSMRERAKLLASHSSTAFANQSVSVTLPETQRTLMNLGVSEETATLTSTKGVVMGMVMCNGFSPMLIIIMTLFASNGGSLPILPLLIGILLIILLGVSSSGAGSTDYTIIISTLSALGLSTDIYLAIMPIQEINEKIYPPINNSAGHILATQLTSKWYKDEEIKEESK